jgi:sugar phosphate isomerase/epimerase
MINRRDLILTGSAALLSTACAPAAQSVSSLAVNPVQKRRVLWAANVRTKSLADRLIAARAGNFTHMSIFPIDWQEWRNSGLSVETMRGMISDAGVKVLAIDPFVQWVPEFAIPDAYPPQNRGFIQFDEAAILRIADEAQAEAINCVEGLGQPHPQALLVDAFGNFADRAAQRGLRVTLEFMPISSITGLREGWAIVDGVNRDNAGLCFDTWHYFRSYEDADTVTLIPANKIFEVQLADATKRQKVPDLVEDLLRFRLLPGDGELDIAAIAAVLESKQALNSVGPEVFADWIDPLPPLEVGKRCGAALGRFLKYPN